MSIKIALIKKGVHIPLPESVDIGADIDLSRISGEDVTIYPGSRLYGKQTFIAKGAQIGFQAPTTIDNCYIGPDVELKGGFFQEAAFLKKSSCGMGAHVRQGTILEEEASIAHTVGLKQTILLPYVTLGSLVNFCDCLMAGGTTRKNHSEVGSSYIHFNYTPNQDKATPSLIGDVPNGVMLNQPPIFLGGQGGMVGPCRITYGTIVAAGCICRKDQTRPNHLVMEAAPKSMRIPFKSRGFRNLHRIISHNLNYIGNLLALGQWYDGVRCLFVGEDFPQALADGLKQTLKLGISERIKQMARLKERVENVLSNNISDSFERGFCDYWETMQKKLDDLNYFQGTPELMDQFIQKIEQSINIKGKDYIQCIKTLDWGHIDLGTQWLQSIVDQATVLLDELKINKT